MIDVLSYRLFLTIIFGIIAFSSVSGFARNCIDTWLPENSRNMVADPGFEGTVGLGSWQQDTVSQKAAIKIVIDDKIRYTGNKALKVMWDDSSDTSLSDQNYFHNHQVLKVIPGLTYQLIGFVKTENLYCESPEAATLSGARIEAYDAINGFKYFEKITPGVYGTNDWTEVHVEFKVPQNTTQLVVRPRRFGGSSMGKSYGTAWWDNIQLLPVPILEKVTRAETEISIYGKSFGNAPGTGMRMSSENCVLYDGACIAESFIRYWSDSLIVIDNIGNGALKVRSGGILSKTPGTEFQLSNSTLSIKFPDIENGAGIGQISDIQTGRPFLDDSISARPLYEFTLKKTPLSKNKTVYTSRDAASIFKTYSNVNGEQTLTVTAHHCEGFTVTSTITMPSTQGGARFLINIQNSGNAIIQSVRYPIIAAKSKLGSYSEDDAILIPFLEGYLLKNPEALSSTNKYRDKQYPGFMTLQMMAYYDSEKPGAGLYLSMDDAEGYKKRFGLERVKQGELNYILFSFLHSTSESPGNNLSLSYHVNVDTFTGDWYEAADRYKQWAINQPWAATKLAGREDVPKWIYDIQLMINCYRCRPDDYAAFVSKYKGLLGVSNMLLFPGGFWGKYDGFCTDTDSDNIPDADAVEWAGIDYFSDDPVYKEAEAESPPYTKLKTAIDDLRVQGSDVLLLIEGGRQWDLYFFKLREGNAGFDKDVLLYPETSIPEDIKCFDDQSHYYEYAAPHITIKEDDLPYYVSNLAIFKSDIGKYNRKTAIICVGGESSNIMDLVLYTPIKRGIDHGARLMSLDQLVAGEIPGCWNINHGHPVGEGKWTHDRYVSILNDIDNIVKSKGMYGNFGLAMENSHELYLQKLQFQYIRHGELHSWGGNKKIPLFNYIYKEYYIGVDPGQSLTSGNGLLYRWGLGMGFIQGHIQGTQINNEKPAYVPNRNLLEFYKRLIKMKRPEFYRGKMLHPPVFNGLQDDITLFFNGTDFFIEPVLTNVLKTDNTISYLLVNVNQDGHGTQDIQFDVIQYDLPSNRVNLKIIKNSREIENQRDVLLPVPVTVNISGGDVVEVRVESESPPSPPLSFKQF